MPRPVSTAEILFGAVILFAWVVMFAAGGIIGTQPYRDRLSSPGDFVTAVRLWFVVISCFTATNVAGLCCLSAYLGTLGRRTRIGGQERGDLHVDGLAQYTSAVIRGFFVFIGLVSGLVALTGTATFTNASPETYLRLAGTASLLSFLAGYKPQLFSRLQGRLDDWVIDKAEAADPGQPVHVTEHTSAAVISRETHVAPVETRTG